MSTRLKIMETTIFGLQVVQRKPIGDNRGYIERLFCADELKTVTDGKAIAQINRTITKNRGTVRGMHFQYPPHAEIKLVSCLQGQVFDVAVDLRSNSATFLQFHAEVLSAENHKTLVIPEGFAHGFQTLTDDCVMLYFHTASYKPESEGGLHAQDPRLAITWPLPMSELSNRDKAHPLLNGAFKGITL